MASKRTDKRKAEQAAQAKAEAAAVCGAATRRNKICKRPAGEGTDHPGRGRCKRHLGTTRAKRLHVAAEELGMATSLRVSPTDAIAAALALSAGQLAYTTAKVAELEEDELYAVYVNRETGIPQYVKNVWLQLQSEVLHDLATFAKRAHDMGIADREATLKEAQTQIIAGVLDRVLGDLNLTPAQRKQVAPAIRKHLVALPDMEEVAA